MATVQFGGSLDQEDSTNGVWAKVELVHLRFASAITLQSQG